MAGTKAKCPGCSAQIHLTEAAFSCGRAMCVTCGRRFDIQREATGAHQPFRSQGFIELVAEPAPPTPLIEDFSGTELTRHIRVNRSPDTRNASLIAVLAGGTIVITALAWTMLAIINGHFGIGVISALVLLGSGALSALVLSEYWNDEDILIDGDTLIRRRLLNKLTVGSRRIAVADISEIVVQSDERRLVEIRTGDGRPPLIIGEALGPDVEAAQWLARHLERGISLARSLALLPPHNGDG